MKWTVPVEYEELELDILVRAETKTGAEDKARTVANLSYRDVVSLGPPEKTY